MDLEMVKGSVLFLICFYCNWLLKLRISSENELIWFSFDSVGNCTTESN